MDPSKTKRGHSYDQGAVSGELTLFFVNCICFVYIQSCTDIDILGVRLDCKLLVEANVECNVSRVPQRIGLLRFRFATCHLWIASFWSRFYSPNPWVLFSSLCHQRRVAGLSMLYKVNSNSNHCLFSELPSASTRVWHTQEIVIAHPLEFEVLWCWTPQFARCFLPA